MGLLITLIYFVFYAWLAIVIACAAIFLIQCALVVVLSPLILPMKWWVDRKKRLKNRPQWT